MHHNRSLLPDVEVLLDVMVKTSRCWTKLLFVILNFYSWIFLIIFAKFSNFNQSSEFFLSNSRIFIKFQNFYQIPEFLSCFRILSNFRMLTKFHNFNQKESIFLVLGRGDGKQNSNICTHTATFLTHKHLSHLPQMVGCLVGSFW